MQEAVHTAQVNEDPEVNDVFDGTLQHLPHFELRQNLLTLLFEFFLNEFAVRHHDILIRRIQLHDPELHALLKIRVEVAYRAHVDLRARQECFETVEELHDHTALDTAYDRTFDNLFVLVDLFDALPAADLVGLLFRQHKLALAVFLVIKVDLDGVAALQVFAKLVTRNDAITLVADIDDNVIVAHLEHPALHDILLPHIDAGAVHQIAELIVHRVGGLRALVLFELIERYRAAYHLAAESLIFFGTLQLVERDREARIVDLRRVEVEVIAGWNANFFGGSGHCFRQQPIYIFRGRVALFIARIGVF